MWKRSGDGWNQDMEDYWNLWIRLFSEMVSQFVDCMIIHVTYNRNLSDETVVMQWNKNIFALLYMCICSNNCSLGIILQICFFLCLHFYNGFHKVFVVDNFCISS